jgi:hypothetical protein
MDRIEQLYNNIINNIRTPQYRWYRNKDIVDNESNKLFDELTETDERLTMEQITNIILALTNGRSNSFLNKEHEVSIKIINSLTMLHNIGKKNISKLLQMPKTAFNKNFDWVENIKSFGYTFDQKELDKLSMLGYVCVDSLLKTKINRQKLEDYSENIGFVALIKICNAKKIKPTSTTILNIMKNNKKMIDKTTLNELIKLEADINNIHLIEFIKQFSDDFEPNIGNIKTNVMNIIDKFINLLIKKKLLNNSIYDDLVLLIKDGQKINSIYNITLILIDNDIKPNLDYLIGILQNTKNINDNMSIVLFNLFFDKLKLVLNEKYSDELAKLSDSYIFTHCMKNNLLKITDNTLENICYTGDCNIIEKFLNMKCIPNINCVKNIAHTWDFMNKLLLLINNGLTLDYDLIEVVLKKDFNIEMHKLINIGLELDENLYFLFYKYNNINLINNLPQYSIYNYRDIQNILEFYDVNSDLKNKLDKFELFYNYKKDKYAGIVNNTIIDQYVYDALFKNNQIDLVKILEKKYNFKPTLITILQTNPNIVEQKYIYQNYIDNNNFHNNPCEYQNIYVNSPKYNYESPYFKFNNQNIDDSDYDCVCDSEESRESLKIVKNIKIIKKIKRNKKIVIVESDDSDDDIVEEEEEEI